jgi:N-acetylglucosaminyl-diphospho-decaprenol L-rhamnosyltransferase
MTDLAIIIVNWNVRDMLAACLRSVQADLAGSNLAAQIWVVDNASTDGSVEMLRRDFPEVRLIVSEKNLGFAGGNNAALRAIGFGDSPQKVDFTLTPQPPLPIGEEEQIPSTILLLNPDTKVRSGALRALFDFLQNTPKAGIAGARLVYGDGSFQHSVFAFPGLWQLAIELLPLPGRLVESRLNGRYPRSLYEGGPFRVGHPLGAALCVRREAITQVGLLDERYYMYAEEVDWCRRMASAGWPAYCVPTATITHFGGQSTGQIRTSSFINLWASRYLFYRKHYHLLKVWLATRLVQVGMRRKAALDTAAAERGELSPDELAKRLACYQKVTHIWQGKQV